MNDKRLNLTVIFSVIVASKRLIEHKANYFYRMLIFEKEISMEIMSEELKPIALENYESENRKIMNIKILPQIRPIKILIKGTK